MRTCLYYICSHKDVYVKLQAEVDAFYEAQVLVSPISYLETQSLPYLQAVVKEALRMLPSIVWQLLRYAPPGLVVDGKEIPAGTPVGMSPLAQNRDPAIWGDDADKFRPERWLEGVERSRYLESRNMTFGGSGPRMCVGRNLALVGFLFYSCLPFLVSLNCWLEANSATLTVAEGHQVEIHKFVAQMVRNFDAQFMEGENPWKIQTTWFAYQKDMHMRIQVRPHTQI